MGYYRKKPVVIEAYQFHGVHRDRLSQWIGESLTDSSDEHLTISTLEGDHRACVGDYIIKGVKGEFYPCKPEIFKLTYEEAN